MAQFFPGLSSGGLSWRTLRVPALVTALWCLLLLALYLGTVHREDQYADGLARVQTSTLYANIVNVRAWNAAHGGIWVEDSERYPANPWLPEEDRRLDSLGHHLIRVNPAYMTRQIADFSAESVAVFRISGLDPIRPENRADPWETAALLSFLEGAGEAFDRVEAEGRFRYMAPLHAETSCLGCHTRHRKGDLLGGISVSIDAAPLLETAAARKRTTGLAYSVIGLVGMVGIGGATLQLNRRREQAEAANSTKSVFLANMSHDMRTPLTGILGMCELLDREAAGRTAAGKARKLLGSLRGAAESLLEVVDGIMRASLVETSAAFAPRTPFSLREEIEACAKGLRPACLSKGLSLSIEVDPATPDALEGEGFRLRQALGNLLGNAVKFTDKGGVRLQVDCVDCPEERADSVLVRCRISDSGPGIPPEERERIFEAFVRGAHQEDGTKSGVGLGLAMARAIARQLGGELTLSPNPEQGSEFVLQAPFRKISGPESALSGETDGADSETAHSEGETAARDGLLQGRRILVAEDSPVTALFFEEVLRQAGAEACVVADAGLTRRQLVDFRPDLALLDLRLPGGSGLSLAEAVRSGSLPGLSRTLPLVLVSATLNEEERARAADLAVDALLLKPVPAMKLVRHLARILPQEKGPEAMSDPIPNATPDSMKNGNDQPLPFFDPALALDQVDGNEALLRRLAAVFLAEEPAARAELDGLAREAEAGFADRTLWLTRLRRQAHRLKNGAGMLGLTALREASACLERESQAPACHDSELKRHLNRVRRALDETGAALRAAGCTSEDADQGNEGGAHCH